MKTERGVLNIRNRGNAFNAADARWSPAEVLLVQRLMGNEKAVVHRTAFVARKGGHTS